MKTIALRRLPGHSVTIPPEVDIIVDSAPVTAGRPLFLPDFSKEWQVTFSPAIRISRLGKDIATRFASRYYDAFTIAMRLIPADPAWQEDGVPNGILGLFDYALGFGEWLPLPEDNTEIEAEGLSFRLPVAEMAVDEVINSVSRYATLKTGDVILPCSLPGTIPVKAGDEMHATVGGKPCLDIRIR